MTRLTRAHLMAATASLPSAPRIHGLILDAMAPNRDTSMADVVRLVKSDTGLATRVLRLANTPVFVRESGGIADLDDALHRIGFREARRLLEAAAVVSLFDRSLPAYGYEAEQLWENSLATALAAESLAKIAGLNPGEAYMAGLLRHVGKLVIARALETHRPGVCYNHQAGPIESFERYEAGFTSSEVAAMVMWGWTWPSAGCLAVRSLYYPLQAPAAARPIVALVGLAACCAADIGLGLEGEEAYLNDREVRFRLARLDPSVIVPVEETLRTSIHQLQEALAAPAGCA